MKVAYKLFLVSFLLLALNACGVGGVTPAAVDCDDPAQANTAECEKQDAESSLWDKMKWDEGKWG